MTSAPGSSDRPLPLTQIAPCPFSQARESCGGTHLSGYPSLPEKSVDFFFTSPPYADARAYSRIAPDHYVDWFLPFAEAMLS